MSYIINIWARLFFILIFAVDFWNKYKEGKRCIPNYSTISALKSIDKANLISASKHFQTAKK